MAIADLTGKLLWLRGQDLGTAGSTIASWANQAPSGGTATGVNSTNLTVEAASTPLGVKAAAFASTGYFTYPLATVSASSSFSSEPAVNAVDQSTLSYWTTNGVVAGWLRLDYVDALTVSAYRIRRRESPTTRNPSAWTFEGSNDGTTWTVLDTKTGQTWPTANEYRTYTLSSAATYSKYRLNITANNGDASYTSLAEFSVVPSGVDLWIVTMSGSTSASRALWRAGEALSASDAALYPYSDDKVYESAGMAAPGNRQSFLPTLSIGSWRIYRVRNDGTTWQAWLDGTSQATASAKAPYLPANFLVGLANGVQYAGGRVAAVLVFNRALNSTEATTVYNELSSTYIAAPPGGSGVASGSFTWVGAAAGVRAPKATANGAFQWSGAAVGAAPVLPALGSATGAFQWVGSATGSAPAVGVNSGNAVGSFNWDGNAVGKFPAKGDAAGSFQWSGAAVGSAPSGVDSWRESAVALERWVSAPVIAPPSERTRWVESAVCGESMEFAPRAIATPPALEVAPIKRLGMKMPAMSATYREPVPFEGGFDIERADVGRLQTIIGGRNFTFARNIPTTLDRFASEGPMCDTQATVRLPLDPWDEIGADDLAAIKEDAQVDVILVRPDGSVEYKWEGFVSAHDDNTDESGEDYTVQCEGLFMQAAHWPWDPPVIAELRDVGHVVADALNSVPNRRWRTIPRVTTGILTSERGQQGWSTWQFVQTVLGKAWTDDGRQWSLSRVARRTYRVVLKASTVAPTFTITKGAPGVGVSLRRDFSTRRDAIFARGYAPDGGYWCGRVFPSLDFGVPPRYPFNNASLNITVGTRDRDTDTGNGVTLWQRQMRELGYPVTVDGVMNSADTKWVYRIQRDRGLTVDGSLGPQTWNATFEDNSHDADLTTYRVPLAFNPDVWPFRYSASGARGRVVTIGAEGAILHAMPEVDWGTDIRKTAAVEPTRRMLEREGTPGWTGTVTLRSDPWEAGSSRLDIREGHNLLILGHYGGTVVQVASADHQDDASVFTVDTKARDAMSLDAIRDRDREARRDAAGRGRTNDRSALNNAQVVQYESESKAGFISRTAVNGNSGLWSVRKAFVSQVGVAKVEFDALSPKAEMVVAIFNRPVRTSTLATLVGDPLASSDSWYDNVELLKSKYGLMEVFGDPGNPGGYYPRQKGDGPLTGKLRDEAGLPYDSPYGGFVWVAMFTSRSTWVEGRIYPAVPQ